MKKITLLLLLSSGFMMAQTKQVVTKFGEIVNINPFVNNGLETNNGYIQLGGDLTHPSVLTTSPSNTLKILGLETGTVLDNILVNDAATGVLKTIPFTVFNPFYWGTTGNAGTDGSNFLGTTDAQDLAFRTNSAERIRINASNGFTGIGLNLRNITPSYMLDVQDDVRIIGYRSGDTANSLILETQTTNFGNQGAGTFLLDGQNTGTKREWFFGKPSNTISISGKNDSFVLKSIQTNAHNTTLPNSSIGTTHLYVDGANNRIGIGTMTPTTALEVTSTTNPLKLNGLQTGATSDQLLTVNASGVVRQQTVSSIVAAGTTHTLGLSGSTLTSTVNSIAPTVNLSTLPIAGDVTGTLAASTVAKINGSPLGTTTGAVTGARLMYNGTQWLPTTSPDWSLTGNAGTNASTNFLGTTDNNDLVFKTSNNERVRVGTNGFMGIGLATGNNTTGTTPNYMLDVIDDIHISSQRAGASTRLILENQGNTPNNALGIFMLDGQSTGSRRQWYMGKAYLAQGTGGNDNFIISSGLTDVVNSGYAGALSAGVSPHFYVDAKNNRIGVNTINPRNTLEINATTDPLRLNGLQTGAKTDNILTVDTNGVVHKSMAMSTGRVQCNGTATITVNDPNITAASSVMLTIQDPTGTGTFTFTVMEGARVSGSSFSIKFLGIVPGPPNTYWVSYLVVY